MPPSLSGGLLCASAAVADIASTAATMPVIALFTEASLFTRRIACGFEIFGAIMPHGVMQRQGAAEGGFCRVFR